MDTECAFPDSPWGALPNVNVMLPEINMRLSLCAPMSYAWLGPMEGRSMIPIINMGRRSRLVDRPKGGPRQYAHL